MVDLWYDTNSFAETYGGLFTTTDDTPLIIVSLAATEGCAFKLDVQETNFSSLLTYTATGRFVATGKRKFEQNVEQVGIQNTIYNIGDYLIAQPTVNIDFNASTNTVDLQLVGKAGLTISWYVAWQFTKHG